MFDIPLKQLIRERLPEFLHIHLYHRPIRVHLGRIDDFLRAQRRQTPIVVVLLREPEGLVRVAVAAYNDNMA